MKQKIDKLFMALTLICAGIYIGSYLQLYIISLKSIEGLVKVSIMNKIMGVFMFSMCKEYSGSFSAVMFYLMIILAIITIALMVAKILKTYKRSL